jgi:hypothetical protein
MKSEEKGNSIILSCTREELVIIMGVLKSGANKADRENNLEKANILDTFQGELNSIQCGLHSTIKFNMVHN